MVNNLKNKLKIPRVIQALALGLPLLAHAEIDISEIPLETLPQTEYIPANRIASQVSSAPSAVSVVTAQDIKAYGYRTLGDILNSMRGLFVMQDYYFQYLGGRGYGIPSDYAGRITLLIDGYRAADGFFGQIYLGNDGFLDVALIDRVEYIPGSGANGNGDNATLGVISITTKKGRDINGTKIALYGGSFNTLQERISYGKQFENGADVVLSASHLYSRGRDYQYETTPLLEGRKESGNNSEKHDRLFFKGAYQGATLEAGFLDSYTQLPSAIDFKSYTTPAVQSNKSAFIRLNVDADLNEKNKISANLYHGQHHFKYRNPTNTADSQSKWYGLDTKLVNNSFNYHTLVFGVEYRNDYQLDIIAADTLGVIADITGQRKTYSAYAYDNFTLSNQIDLNFGARYDASDNGIRMLNPRGVFIYKPSGDTTLKLSHGLSQRQATPFENVSNLYNSPEKTRTSELVWEQNLGWQSHLLTSLYVYSTKSTIYALSDPTDRPNIRSKGLELEYEKAWDNGVRLRTSYAKQLTKIRAGERARGSPKDNVKLNLTVPIIGEQLRAGLDVRYLGSRLTIEDEPRLIGGYTVADFTLSSSQFLPNWDASLSIKNLFDRSYGDISYVYKDLEPTFKREGRNVWLQLEYTIK